MLSRSSRTRWMIVAAAILAGVVVFFIIARYGPLKKLLPSSDSPAADGAPGGFLQFNRDRTLEIQPDARPALPPADFVPGQADSEDLVGTWATEANAEYLGNDILRTRSTIKECQRQCELTVNCVGITYDKYDGFFLLPCWLKSSMPPSTRFRNTEMESLRLTNRT